LAGSEARRGRRATRLQGHRRARLWGGLLAVARQDAWWDGRQRDPAGDPEARTPASAALAWRMARWRAASSSWPA